MLIFLLSSKKKLINKAMKDIKITPYRPLSKKFVFKFIFTFSIFIEAKIPTEKK